MAKAIDLDNFYQVPADNRDLNYGQYFENGDIETSIIEDYNSHNTRRLDVEGMMALLLKLDIINDALNDERVYRYAS